MIKNYTTQRDVTRGIDPPHRPLTSWWRGTNIEAAFRQSHQAEAELAKLCTSAEVQAEAAAAVARTERALNRDDPVRAEAHRLLRPLPAGAEATTAGAAAATARRLLLSKSLQVGYEAVDSAHTRLRNLRNVLFSTTAWIAVLVIAFVIVVALNPSSVPLCFGPQDSSTSTFVACPSAEGDRQRPQALDVVVVAVLGLLGGALGAALSIRNLHGTNTPYDIPIALASLKVPVGALTSIGALIAVRGAFVPGLSALDSQEQILAYALIFGYAQQLLTGVIDKRALGVLASVPSKDADPGAAPPLEPAAEHLAVEPAGLPSTRTTRDARSIDALSEPAPSHSPPAARPQ